MVFTKTKDTEEVEKSLVLTLMSYIRLRDDANQFIMISFIIKQRRYLAEVGLSNVHIICICLLPLMKTFVCCASFCNRTTRRIIYTKADF